MLSRSLVSVVASLMGVLALSGASMDAGLEGYEDLLMQDLYKRLASDYGGYVDLADVPPEFRGQRDYEVGPLAALGDDQPVGSPVSGGASIRDSEYIQHSSNAGSQGFIHMSGGAGEGQQHLKPDGSVSNIKPGASAQVKSDESLPFYCHPTNPCPKGMTNADGCQENVEDTAEAQKEWISQMQLHGFCSCDHEHMFDCPEPQALPGKQLPSTDDQAFKEIMDKILSDKASATYMSGEKRLTLVAKKSPRAKRETSKKLEEDLIKVNQAATKYNPYLQGDKLRTVAKKG